MAVSYARQMTVLRLPTSLQSPTSLIFPFSSLNGAGM